MSYDTPFACVTTDTGIAAELLHVSPIFVRCGPRVRGTFAERRLARTRRTEARHAQRRTTRRGNSAGSSLHAFLD
jgi:hypothetical protein